MKNSTKNLILVFLSIVIVAAIGVSVYAITTAGPKDDVNHNVTLVTAPDQEGFETHPEWTLPVVEEIDYGENIALGKDVKEDGHTQVYFCKNINDGNRFTYWEGKADAYPNNITFDMGESVSMRGARILLNPRQIWSARTQEVEIQVSDDGENFSTVYAKTALEFDPMTDNGVYLEFDAPVAGQYIRFVFYSNTGATAGQAAEIEIYAP